MSDARETPNCSFIGITHISVKVSRCRCSNIVSSHHSLGSIYCKVPKFSDNRKLCCINLPKIQEKRPNLSVFRQKDANGIANSGHPDQTAPLGAV